MSTCLKCKASEQEKPLLVMAFKGETIYICPQCLPVLIHKPANLADELEGAEQFGNAAEHHH